MSNQVLEEIKSQIKTGNASEVSELVRKTIKRKLEEEILKMIDSQDGDITDLEELMSLAERYGFKEISSVLERYSYETLRNFARTKRESGKRNSREEKHVKGFRVETKQVGAA
ncbi:MAG: hypothetical protein AABX54_02005 [Nanoarchaeota archaeon]